MMQKGSSVTDDTVQHKKLIGGNKYNRSFGHHNRIRVVSLNWIPVIQTYIGILKEEMCLCAMTNME